MFFKRKKATKNHCKKSRKITSSNPCTIGDVVITGNGWDCGLVIDVRDGLPTRILSGRCWFDNVLRPAEYGGVEYLTWYKTDYNFTKEFWFKIHDDIYHEFREMVRNKYCRYKET